MHHTPLLRATVGALLLSGSVTGAMAGAVSHVETLARASAPGAYDEDAKTNKPYWGNAGGNSLSSLAVAEGIDAVGNKVKVAGAAGARADFSFVNAHARGSSAGVSFGGQPAATSSGQSGAILQMDWIVTGSSGVFGTIYVSGGLWAGGSGDPSLPGAGHGAASADIMASLFKDQCFGAGCWQFRQLKVQLDGKENIDGPPTVSQNYTLAVDVKPGDHVYLQYVAAVSAGGGYNAWAGTTPDLSTPGGTLGARADRLAVLSEAEPSFAQRIWLSNGLGLAGAEGLTRLGDGSYGFGETAVVPEPGTWALLLAGLGVLGLRARFTASRSAARTSPLPSG